MINTVNRINRITVNKPHGHDNVKTKERTSSHQKQKPTIKKKITQTLMAKQMTSCYQTTKFQQTLNFIQLNK